MLDVQKAGPQRYAVVHIATQRPITYRRRSKDAHAIARAAKGLDVFKALDVRRLERGINAAWPALNRILEAHPDDSDE